MLSSLPSPPSGSLEIWSLKFNAYGLMIALGVVAAVWLSKKRFMQKQIGKPDDASSIAMVAVPVGVVGARLYHVATDWERFDGRFLDVFKIWQGGLGVWGGISFGVVAGVFVARKKGIPISAGLSCVAPAIALAQSIGRWGNWFNQELFGKPTELFWALEVSAARAEDAGFTAGTTFHPTFLYESLGCLIICVGLIKVEKLWKLREGSLFGLYVASYTFLRFFVESLRIDKSKQLAGLRFNQWTSIVVFGCAVIYLVYANKFSKAAKTSDSPQDLQGSQG